MDTNQFPTTLKLMCRNFYIGPIFHTTPYWHTFLGHHFPLIANGPRKKRQSLVLSITANLFDVTRPVVDIVFLYVASCVLFWCCECFCHCHVPFHFVVVIVPRFSAWPCVWLFTRPPKLTAFFFFPFLLLFSLSRTSSFLMPSIGWGQDHPQLSHAVAFVARSVLVSIVEDFIFGDLLEGGHWIWL